MGEHSKGKRPNRKRPKEKPVKEKRPQGSRSSEMIRANAELLLVTTWIAERLASAGHQIGLW
jgi:hypothetical protein